MADMGIVCASADDQNALVIDGKSYDLTEIPSYTDPLVQNEVQSVLGRLNLNDITDNLQLSVELYYVAYNGVAGAKGGELQAEIARLQSKLALLCNDCVTAMTLIESETRNILTELTQVYRYLTAGQEKMAVKKIANCSKSATVMSEGTSSLSVRFAELQVESTKVRSITITEEASQYDKKLAAEKAAQELIAKQKAETKNQEALVDQIADIEVHYQDAKEREDRASTKALILGITSAIAKAAAAGLAAFGATQNPTGTLFNKGINGTRNNVTGNDELDKAKKEASEKQAKADEAQKELTKLEDQRSAQEKIIQGLEKEIQELTENINKMEQDSKTDKEKLTKAKDERTEKQAKLKTANEELSKMKEKVATAEKTAKDYTAAYAAAAATLKELANSLGELSDSEMAAERKIHDEKMALLNRKLELEKEKRKSLVDLVMYAETIKNLKIEEGQAALSVDALHVAVEALGKIIASLTNASLFWRQMSLYCKKVAEQGFVQQINDLTDPATGMSLEARLAEYRSMAMMKSFLLYLCQWSAINGLSHEYKIAASAAQSKSVHYISQSPTIDEALKQAPKLAKDLGKILEDDLEKSRQKSSELEQEKAIMEKDKADNKPAVR